MNETTHKVDAGPNDVADGHCRPASGLSGSLKSSPRATVSALLPTSHSYFLSTLLSKLLWLSQMYADESALKPNLILESTYLLRPESTTK